MREGGWERGRVRELERERGRDGGSEGEREGEMEGGDRRVRDSKKEGLKVTVHNCKAPAHSIAGHLSLSFSLSLSLSPLSEI